MENKDIARILWETGDLMEIAGEDSFRIRSYRNGATAVEGHAESVSAILRDPERKVTDISGIGKGLAFVLKEIEETGTCERRSELLPRWPVFIHHSAPLSDCECEYPRCRKPHH